jgi:HEAT repeats
VLSATGRQQACRVVHVVLELRWQRAVGTHEDHRKWCVDFQNRRQVGSDLSRGSGRNIVMGSSACEPSDANVARLKQLPERYVIPTLEELFHTSKDDWVTSRAFHAILRLGTVDPVEFLSGSSHRCADVDWRMAFSREVGELTNTRALAKLSQVLLHDDHPDVRSTAAQALGNHGDETVVEALEYARAHDAGLDFQGDPVCRAAE